MPNTARGLTYPDSSGHTRLWEHFQELAVDTDAALDAVHLVCTSSTRPAHAEGRTIYETDTDTLLASDGAAWYVVKAGGPLPEATAWDVASVGVAANVETTIYSGTLALGSSYRRLTASFTFCLDTAGTNVGGNLRLMANGAEVHAFPYTTDSDNPAVPRWFTLTLPVSRSMYTGDVAVQVRLYNYAGSDNSLFIKHLSGHFRGISC